MVAPMQKQGEETDARDWTYVILGLLLLCWAVCPIGVWSDSWQLHDGSEEVTATMPGCKLDRAGQGR